MILQFINQPPLTGGHCYLMRDFDDTARNGYSNAVNFRTVGDMPMLAISADFALLRLSCGVEF
jgi:hypothetical protein